MSRRGDDAANETYEGERMNESRASEEKMRRAFEVRRGAPFSDDEWEEAKRNLVGIFLMLGTDAQPPDDVSSDENE